VSVKEKAGVTCQVWYKETSASEPLTKCRNGYGGVKTGGVVLTRDKPGGGLLTVQAASGIKAA